MKKVFKLSTKRGDFHRGMRLTQAQVIKKLAELEGGEWLKVSAITTKSCNFCEKEFYPKRPTQSFCGATCAQWEMNSRKQKRAKNDARN